jgi:hypothetical protein
MLLIVLCSSCCRCYLRIQNLTRKCSSYRVSSDALRSYASLECDACPQVIQFAVDYTLGMPRVSQMRISGVVAADPKPTVFHSAEEREFSLGLLLRFFSLISQMITSRMDP